MHVEDGQSASTETDEITSSIRNTLVEHGLNVQTIAIESTDISAEHPHVVQWRVDVAFLGEPILISPAFVVAMGNDISALGGVHANSIWQENEDLVIVSRVPA